MSGSTADETKRSLSVERAALAIAGLVVGSGGVYLVIWTALGFVLQ